MIPGEIEVVDGNLELNEGRNTVSVTVGIDLYKWVLIITFLRPIRR